MARIHISFSGDIVKRGFWVYVWRIKHKSGDYFYVGRTGDSSSVNAASPMSRMSAHFSRNPKGNALKRNLLHKGVEMEDCTFEYHCFGPLMEEKDTWEAHRKARDLVATVELNVAEHLKRKGHQVIGQHQLTRKSDDSNVIRFTEEISDSLDQILECRK